PARVAAVETRPLRTPTRARRRRLRPRRLPARRPRARPLRRARAPPPRRPASGRSFVGGLVLEVLVVQPVAELVAFRREVACVLEGRRRLDRHLFHDLDAEAL